MIIGGLLTVSGMYLVRLRTEASAMYAEMYFCGFCCTLQTGTVMVRCHGARSPVHCHISFHLKVISPLLANRRLYVYTAGDFDPLHCSSHSLTLGVSDPLSNFRLTAVLCVYYYILLCCMDCRVHVTSIGYSRVR
jgi:hypothetical protein